jgi:enolase-phosphatase E1
MIAFRGRLILLDIEGTVSPLAFVHEVMFPYARKHVAAFLETHWSTPAVGRALDQMAVDAGRASLAEWCPAGREVRAFAEAAVHALMDVDAKATGLKVLQGLIWQEGFSRGELRSLVFADVPPALAAWHGAGIDLRIYSSGSTQAQRLFFAHTTAGDLTAHFSGHYDTTVGSKRATASYAGIAADAGVPAGEILFVSDVEEELDAARAAGMQTALSLRPGNPPQPRNDHPAIHTLAEIVGASAGPKGS